MGDQNQTLEERLGDVAKAGVGYMKIDQILEQYKKDPTNPEIFNAFVKYGGEQLPEDEVKLLRSDVYRTRGLMERCLEEDQKNLIDQTSNNISSILSQFSAKDLYQFAAVIPDKDKKYVAIVEALEKRTKDSVEKARKAYAQTFNNKVWRAFMEEEATDEEILHYASRYAQIKQSKFMNQFVSVKEVDGKKKPEIDPHKLFAYVGKQILSYKPKEKQEVYLQLGQMYTQMMLQKAEEAKKSNVTKVVFSPREEIRDAA